MKENLIIQTEQENTTVTILEGKAPEPVNPVNVSIEGVLSAPLEYIRSRLPVLIPKIHLCHILVNKEDLKIDLIVDEKSPHKDFITGKLKLTDEFLSFRINTGKSWVSRELGEFIKMNRSCFESHDVAKVLSAKLVEFRAKIEKDLEAKNDNRGNVRLLRDQKIKDCNIPENFKLNISVFKDTPKKTIEIEIYINPDDYSITLVSPDAADIVKTTRDEAINQVIEDIKAICPEITIIEV